jgi:formylglycine-generating enzyme required for sulfatase activity
MIEIDWVPIPGGKFIFGLSAGQLEALLDALPEQVDTRERQRLRQRLQVEMPEREVMLDTFYISRYPITNRQDLEFALSNHHYSDANVFAGEKKRIVLEGKQRLADTKGDHPADSVWHSAMAFCDWIGARLPTSVEWEKAARSTDGRLYPWGNTWDANRGNFALDRERWPGKTSPVTAYPSGQSSYGVMDMMGNTYEWTLSTMLGIGDISPRIPTELVICRSCSCDFSETETPDWFRNRVTAIIGNEMHSGGAHLVGFRPVLDDWQRQSWPGMTLTTDTTVGESGAFLTELLTQPSHKSS